MTSQDDGRPDDGRQDGDGPPDADVTPSDRPDAEGEGVINILDRLAERGVRVTESRQTIVEVVGPRHDHFSAQDVFAEARRRDPTIGRATVFRTLDLLTELEILERVHIGDGCHRFAVCESQHHHHLICIDCERVIPIEAAGLEQQVQQLAEQADFSLLAHHVELIGRCPSCRARA